MPNEQTEIKIADNIPGAEYTNMMQVGHAKEEFRLIFMNVMPPSGKVVSKIITTPGHFKRIIAAMQENLQKKLITYYKKSLQNHLQQRLLKYCKKKYGSHINRT